MFARPWRIRRSYFDRRTHAGQKIAPVSLQELESRLCPATTIDPASILAAADGSSVTASHFEIASPASYSSYVGLTPAQIRHAYGIDNLSLTGAGQTIAIVDAYDNPNLVNSTSSSFSTSDLAKFDAQFGLADPPSFKKLNQNGGTTLPGTDPAGAGNANGTWELEEALDVEWAHAIAPGANIVLIECNSSNLADLYRGIRTAAGIAGVSVISISWGSAEFSTEVSQDSNLLNGHTGITVVASTGDNGAPGTYPAYSPQIVAVGGTFLALNADGSYSAESAWSGSGGGTSLYESEPSYQTGVQSTGFRTIPDVSFVASPSSGVAVYDSYDNTGGGPWFKVGGTSLSAPCWGGLIALVNQGRAQAGYAALNGSTQTLPALYKLPSSDFHDITTGGNQSFAAGVGYDQVTGLGTPKAELVVPDLIAWQVPNKLVVTTQPPSSSTAGTGFTLKGTVEDKFGNILTSYSGTATIAFGNNAGAGTLSGTTTVNIVNGVATFSGLSVNKAASGYTLQISSNGLITGMSNVFTITPATATQLVVSNYPPIGVITQSSFGLTVWAVDNFGNLATSFNGTINVTINSNPGGATLTGTTSLNATQGVAVFSNLILDQPGLSYSLRLTSSGLIGVTTNSFDAAGYRTVVNGSVIDLAWFGTTGSDTVSFVQTDATTVQITMTKVSGLAVNNVANVTGITGRVIVQEYDGVGDSTVINAEGLTSLPTSIMAGDGDDSIAGGNGSGNYISVGNGDDWIIGNGSGSGAGKVMGNNTIVAGNGDDYIFGNYLGDGGEGGNNTIIAGDGNNTIVGNAGGNGTGVKGGNNFIQVGNGDNTIVGNFAGDGGEGGDNTIITGNGNNTVFGNFAGDGAEGGNNLIVTGSGNDTIYAHAGQPLPAGTTSGSTKTRGRDLVVSGGGADTIYGWDSTYTTGTFVGDINLTGRTTLTISQLQSILAEWVSSDSYAARIARISGNDGTSGANGSTYLIPGQTVFDDLIPAIDSVWSTNGSVDDWFLASLSQDVLHNVDSGETITDLS